VKSPAEGDIVVTSLNVTQQTNGVDCGIYAATFAFELALQEWA
jgi:Ulp1 family protease